MINSDIFKPFECSIDQTLCQTLYSQRHFFLPKLQYEKKYQYSIVVGKPQSCAYECKRVS